jgi:hypothetical protein
MSTGRPIVERAGVPKGLVRYCFRREPDLLATGGPAVADEDVASATALVAPAVSYRHPVARNDPDGDRLMDRELVFVASALAWRARRVRRARRPRPSGARS